MQASRLDPRAAAVLDQRGGGDAAANLGYAVAGVVLDDVCGREQAA
jgi:hypothetical protein